jgi:hypothetical protein
MTKRIVIDRLDLTLRGIDEATAQAAARLLGPALSLALQQRSMTTRSMEKLNAGHMEAPASPSPAALATHIARQIARQIARHNSTPRATPKNPP